jgi:hypothetical protein
LRTRQWSDGSSLTSSTIEAISSPNSPRGLRVLEGVVQQRRGEGHLVAHPALEPQHVRELERMVDVRLGSLALATLVAVLPRGEARGAQQQAGRLRR